MKRSTKKYLLLSGLSLIVIFFISLATITPVIAKAPPEPVCGVCTSQINEAANDHGVALERGGTTMNIQLSQNGTAEFVAHVELAKGAERLRNNTLREAIVRDVSYMVVDNRRDLQTAIVDGNLRVQYSSREVAHKTLGVLQFDVFHIRGAPPFASGGEGSPYPGADSLTLRAPTGYQVSSSHGDFTNETLIRWKGDSQEQYSGHIKEDVTISFVPEQTRFPKGRVVAANFLDRVRSLSVYLSYL
jgi:hypothetical protein